ncbi:helix-turn-helix domain-containing protein [Collinsella stercoris]|uniref:helix-turn-helix domain-containing protein n=1 Tax=Collinsella stercoris TaxID=147206 RepID=UPI00248DC847|nr:helix-turn-helix transcriptional regulator [Collinsella stercoris]
MTYNIKSERVRIGMSQEEVAEELGVHVNSVRQWESNSVQPSSMSLISLSRLFGCSPDYLLGLTDERTVATR